MIIKRDGRRVNFDKDKILNAIKKSITAVNGDNEDEYLNEKMYSIADRIESTVNNNDKDFSVEIIQDLVEQGLMSSRRKDIAKAYILYRENRSRERDRNRKLTKTIREKIEASNVANQNANVDERSFGGRRGEAVNEYMKHYALNYIVSDMSRSNHLNNEIYIHDLDSYAVGMHNCLSIPFDDLLKNGFNTRQTDVRPANSINTAFQLVAVIFQLQSLQQFGGCSATHLDWTMVPYVRKSFYKHFADGLRYIECADNIKAPEKEIEDMSINDDWYTRNSQSYKYAMEMTERELKQAVEGMYHNLRIIGVA